MNTHGYRGLTSIRYDKKKSINEDDYKSLADLIEKENIKFVHLKFFWTDSEIAIPTQSMGREYIQLGAFGTIDTEYSYTGYTTDRSFKRFIEGYDIADGYVNKHAKIYTLDNGVNVLVSTIDVEDREAYKDDYCADEIQKDTTDLEFHADIVEICGKQYFV